VHHSFAKPKDIPRASDELLRLLMFRGDWTVPTRKDGTHHVESVNKLAEECKAIDPKDEQALDDHRRRWSRRTACRVEVSVDLGALESTIGLTDHLQQGSACNRFLEDRRNTDAERFKGAEQM
jgi:hypothetical protein